MRNKILNILLVIVLLIIVFILNFTFIYSENTREYKKSEERITSLFKEDVKDYACTKNDSENIESIAKEFNFKFHEGELVKEKLSKHFQNGMIPSDYKISKVDLENAYALAIDEKPLYVVLSFKDEEKYKKLKEFIGIGEAIVGYSMKSNNKEKYIFLGKDFKTLNEIQKVYNKKKCY